MTPSGCWRGAPLSSWPRLTQAADADRIVVLDHGHVLEVGTHEELLTTGGAYADLWQAWSAGRPQALAS